tara:strand:+ start:817 stop:1980 length:1164 start_codon:yes stop_codon:yes gene_type:complete
LVSERKNQTINLTAIILLVITLFTNASNDTETETRQKLSAIKSQISSLQLRLEVFKKEKNSIQLALRKPEITIGKIQISIQKTRDQLAAKNTQLRALESERYKLIKAKGLQQVLMEHEIQTAYQAGRQSQIKILLNQEDPHTIARNIEYFKYFNLARSERIKNYLAVIHKLEVLRPNIASVVLALQQTDLTLRDQLAQIQLQKTKRKIALNKLNSNIKNSDQQLLRLQKNRSKFEELLNTIEQAVANLDAPSDYQTFAKLKGTMIWPVKGKAENKFGQLRSGGPLRWQGLMIDAKEGSPVHAIHHGRIVYADWFRGSGLLLIIDHGDGYMSLYAHNQSLYKEVGEWVSANEVVSTVGNSGGQFKSALYFEIRKQGKPNDPSKWCKNS